MESQITKDSAQHHLLDLPNDQAEEEDYADKDFLEQNLRVDQAIQKLDDKLSAFWMIIYRLWLVFCAVYALFPTIILLFPSHFREWNRMNYDYGNLWTYPTLFAIFGNAITMTLSCILVWVAACTKSFGIISKAILLLRLNILMVSIVAFLILKRYSEFPNQIGQVTLFLYFAWPFVAWLNLVHAVRMKETLKERKMLTGVSSIDALQGRWVPNLIDWEVEKLDKELSTCLVTFYRVWLIILWFPSFSFIFAMIYALNSKVEEFCKNIATLGTAITSTVFGPLVWMAVRTKSLAKIEKAILIFVVNLVLVIPAMIGMNLDDLKNSSKRDWAGLFDSILVMVLLFLHLPPAIHIRDILQKRKYFTDLSEAAKSNSQND